MALYKIYVVKRGQLEKQDRNNLRVFIYDAGEGWIRSDETVTLRNEFIVVVQEERTSCVGKKGVLVCSHFAQALL